jgi:hypothetical protein
LEEVIAGLLPDLARWRSSATGGKEITLLDYVGFVATPDLLFAFAELFRPALVLHAGVHFIRDRFDTKAFDDWRSRLGDLESVQKMMNHLHVSTILQGQSIPDDVAVWSARLIADIWSSVFSQLGLRGLAFGESLHDAAVTLYSPR